MAQRGHHFGLVLLTVCSLLFSGCGGSGKSQRIEVQGKVELAGSPAPPATITFSPAPGHTGPAGNGSLSADGKYHLSSEDGPFAGPHQVLIKLLPTKFSAPKTSSAAGGATKSEWTFDVVIPEKGPFEKDFVLD